MDAGSLVKPNTRLSARTDESALFGPANPTDPARYGVGVAVAVRVAVRVMLLVAVRVAVLVRVAVGDAARVVVCVISTWQTVSNYSKQNAYTGTSMHCHHRLQTSPQRCNRTESVLLVLLSAAPAIRPLAQLQIHRWCYR